MTLNLPLPAAWKPYAKFVVVIFGSVIAIVGRHVGADNELYLDIVTLATALGVFSVPNESAS